MSDFELLKTFAERFGLNLEMTEMNNFCATYDLDIPDTRENGAEIAGVLRFSFRNKDNNAVGDEPPYFVDYREEDEQALRDCLFQLDNHKKFEIIHEMLDDLEDEM